MVASRCFAITFLFLGTVLPGFTAARAAPMEPPEPAPSEAVSVPPLVPAEPAPELVPAPELTPAPDLIGMPLDADSPEVRSGSSIPLPLRALLESMGAGVTGAVGGLLGILLTDRLGGCSGDDDCLPAILLGGFGGALVGAPVGVFATGRLMGVRGGLGSSYLGLLVGGGGALVASVLLNGSGGDGAVFVSVPLAAVMGSVIGFELSEDTTPGESRPEPRRGSSSPALLLSPTAGTTPRGGFIGGVSGRF